MGHVTASEARNFLICTAGVFVAYVLSYFLVWAVVTPLQAAFLPEVTAFASLLFLPHGVKVLSTSLLRGKAVPGLVLGEVAGNYAFWGLTSPRLLLAVALASGTVTWLVFEALRALRINATYLAVSARAPALHTLILAGIAASAANAFLLTVIMEGAITPGRVMEVLAVYMTGDVAGLLICLLAARLIMVPVLEPAE